MLIRVFRIGISIKRKGTRRSPPLGPAWRLQPPFMQTPPRAHGLMPQRTPILTRGPGADDIVLFKSFGALAGATIRRIS